MTPWSCVAGQRTRSLTFRRLKKGVSHVPTGLIGLLPLILGAALAPFWVIAVLLLLASPRGLAKATAFVSGMTLVRLLQGVLFGYIFGQSPEVANKRGGPSPVVSTLLMLAGIFLSRPWASVCS
jgi:hypothetical protein